MSQGAGGNASTVARILSLVAAGILVVLSLAGGLFVVGENLARVHPVLGVLYGLAVAVLVLAGVVYPLARTMARPEVPLCNLRKANGMVDTRRCKAFARELMERTELSDHERARLAACLDQDGEIDRRLVDFFTETYPPKMQPLVKTAAKRAFFATAVSQSPLVDAATVLSINFDLIRSLVECCGYRPQRAALVRLYLRVMASSLIAGGIEDADLEDMFEGVLGGVGGHAGGLVFASAAQGFANAVLVFRVGVVTERYLCTTKKGIRQEELRRGSYAEALRRLRTSGFVQEVLQVIGQKTSRVVGGAVTAARDAATAAGKAAKETVATRLGAALETIENAVRRKTEQTKGRAIEGQGGTGGPDGRFLGCAEAEFPQSGTS